MTARMAEDNQVRVILWSIHRTVSTAFEKSMSNLDNVQIIHEPYLSVYYSGPDKRKLPESMKQYEDKFYSVANAVQMDYRTGWTSETATYKLVKENVLEDDYPDKKVVFVKDMVYGITQKLDMLPNGYRHAFLIRNPVKVFASWKKVLNRYQAELNGNELTMNPMDGYIPEKYGFGESFQLYEHLVKTGIEPNPVIIDSDDLLENPESILSQFCSHIGIQYTDKLMNWNSGDDVIHEWKASNVFIKGNKVFEYYKAAFQSTAFNKPKPEPNRSELDDDVNMCIDAALPHYWKMYALRLIP